MRLPHVVSILACSLLTAGCDTADGPTSLAAPEAQLAVAHQGTCDLALSVREARAALQDVRDAVDALQETGSLNRGQAHALRTKLRNADRQIEVDRACPAVAQLQAFLEQVAGFVRSGILSAAEAEPLLNGVELALHGSPSPAFEVISGGRIHTCGLTEAGAAYCWGANTTGALGDGTTTDRLVPTPVSGGHTFVAISAGQFATCGLTASGDAYCWGDNTDGQLGDGTTTHRLVPTLVSGGHAFTSISAGGNFFVCGLTFDGDAYCWGRAARGQLGAGPQTGNRSVPTPVSGGHVFAAITAGSWNACGLEVGGDAYCWGENEVGTLGDGSTLDRSVPTAVTGGHVFTSLNAAHGHTCGLTATGDAYCWGFNLFGRLGDGTTTDRLVPTPVTGGHSFTALGRGFGHHTCGVEPGGITYCWGWNGSGQLGDGTTTNRSVPTPVDGGHEFAFIAIGGNHTCGIANDGALSCWGFNSRGQLGDGTTTNQLVPTAVSMPTGSR